MTTLLQQNRAAICRYVKMLCCSVFFFVCTTVRGLAQEPEELGLLLTVPRVGSTEMPALVQGDTTYLSITALFDYLRIKNTLSPGLDTVSGFFLSPSAPFLISRTENKIWFQNKHIALQPKALLQTETGLYLRLDYFGEIFGLDCVFDFRSLSINLTTKLELPVIREMQLAFIRKNISQLKGERKADTTLRRQFPLFRLGMADLGVNAGQYAGGQIDTRLSLSLGGMVLGGETQVSLNATPGQKLDLRQQFYRWRYVNNDKSLLRQVSAGTFFPESVSTLTSAVSGLQFSNTPTTYRKSFGTYILSDKTEPGWTVELYVNNILVNYTRADASGFYTFDVPMVYGSSQVKLRFYGPWGEERTKEENIVVPFYFLPENQFEYTLSGGLVSRQAAYPFARLNTKYGLTGFLTLGGGMEYFAAVRKGQYMPYGSAALRLFSKLILYGEHTLGVRTKGILNYRHRSNLQVDINYTKYTPGQTAVTVLEESKAVVSIPIRTKSFTAFSRLTLSRSSEMTARTTAAEWLVSSFFSGVSTNFSTYAILNQPGNPLVRSAFSFTFRLPAKMRFTQQMQYEYNHRNFSQLRAEVEKNVFRTGFLNLAGERNLITGINQFSLGLRFNLSGIQASLFALRSRESFSMFQTVKSSLLYNDQGNHLQFSSQSTVGRAALCLEPFLDLNGNGRRDAGEQRVAGLKVKVNGGRLAINSKDTTLEITGLEAYANYLLELDKNSFDNVAWQIARPLLNVVAEPNYFRKVPVPVSVLGEVQGKVLLQTAGGQKEQGRVIVRFYKNGQPVATVMSEADGYFSYMGFLPGDYSARVDSDQLEKLHLTADPGTLFFTIKANPDGDLLQDLQFLLKPDANKGGGPAKSNH